GAPRLKRAEIPRLGEVETPFIRENFLYNNHRFAFTAVSMGNAHAVIFDDDGEKEPLTTLGPVLETHEMFTERVNVESIEILNDDEMK
ncbi:diaminopimelate epimerase, partial [Bacillus thuringiensis]|nr:diaminopimelate epimerase [Bacillus thuringiensis]